MQPEITPMKFLCLLILFCLPVTAIKVGVTAGPHIAILTEVQKAAKKQGLDIEIVEFNDFIMPNAALDQGDIDANIYQHAAFLKDHVQTRGYQLTAMGTTILLPLGLYPGKLKSLKDCKPGATIAIPNDPTNGGRALKLLAKAGLLTLKDVENPSVLDITENPQGLKIKEVEAPQIPRVLGDVDFAITNTDWILAAGLDPKMALFQESKDSPYANILVVRTQDKTKAELLQLKALYQSAATRNFILKEFKGAVLPVF